MKGILVDRWEIAIIRVAHACAQIVSRKTGEAVAMEDLLPIVAPDLFAGQEVKTSLYQYFTPGGQFAPRAYGSTAKELVEAAKWVFGVLEPLAIEGFQKMGKPNLWSQLARVAYAVIEEGGRHE